MTIYSPSGAVVYEAPITKSAIIRRELMGDYYIELVFDAVDRIDIGRGCYILYNNHRFEIMNNVIPDDTNQGGLRYTLRFESQQSQMKRCNVFWREGDNLEVSFALTSDISTFGQLIIDNVNAFLGGSTFSLGSVPSGAEMKTISFAGDSCWDAVATIAETFGVEWWTEEDGDNVRLCFGKLEIGDSVEFRKGDIVSSIPSKKGDNANYGTRFYVFGSTKNLPEDYGSTVEGGITNNVVEKRLHLPDGMQYIDAWPNLAPEDIVEKTVFFEDVMPTNVETITEVYSGNAEVIPGTSHKVYDVVCANSPFTLDDVIEGETIQANFTSGSLNGQTFDLELTQTSGVFNKTFRIVPKILDRDSLTILPQGEMIPRAGDTFILLNVNLPKGRINEAEQRLLEVGQEYVKKNSSDTEIYDCPTNAVYCHKNDCNYVLGQRVTLVGDMFGDGRQSRIQGYEKKLYDEYQATYTVGDNSAYSRLASLEKSIRRANYSDRVGLEANIIRSKNDTTIPSDFNVYSALASEEMFLSKRRGGTVKGHTNFEKGISLYGMPIYDAEKKRWTLEGDLLVTGAMTMYGLAGGEKPSTIMDAVQVDGHSILKEGGVLKINPDYHFNGGGTGGGGVADSVAWSNVTNKPTWITDTKPKYSYSEILDTPDLSVYATKSSVSDISTQLNDFLSGSDTDTIINKWKELEVFLSGLSESDNLATLLSGKASKATTLAGYGITDAYTKTQVDNAIGSLNKTYVTIAGTGQEITTIHNFVNGFKVGGLPIKKSQDKTLYLDANLVVSGAITMYGSDSTTFPTIWANIPFDNTMSWNGSKWSVVGGGTGGGISIADVENYLTGEGYITSDALEPYALKSSIPTNTNQLTNGAGFITGITSSMVTNALGYTPLSTGGGTITGDFYIKKPSNATIIFQPNNAANSFWLGVNSSEEWFCTNGGYTETYKLIHSGNYRSYPVKNPNALSWSGYSSGSYDGSTAQSIALPTKLSQLTDDVVSGKYLPITGGTISGSGVELFCIDRSDGNPVISFRYNESIMGRLGFDTLGNLKAQVNGVYCDIVHSGNVGDYALPIKGGTVHGNVKATSFIGNLTGNADSATTLKTSTGYMYARAFNVDKIVDIGADATFQGYSTYIDGMYIRFRYGSANATAMQIGTDGNVSIGGTTADELLHVYGVAKATLLKSAQGYTLTSSAATYCGLIPNNIITGSGNATDFWLYNTTDIKYQAANHYFVGGNVAIGGTTASEKLHVYGNILVAGTITFFSQASLKNVINREGLSLDELAQIRPARFKWKDGRDDRVHVGAIADEIVEVLPEVVYFTGEEKTMTMDYASAGHFIATSLIKPVIDHEARIKYLEAEVKTLKQENKKLKQLVA